MTGCSGFVASAVSRCVGEFDDIELVHLVRETAAAQIRHESQQAGTARCSLLHLAWPSLQQVSASGERKRRNESEWDQYKKWVRTLVSTCAESDVRFFQVSSGIERYGLTEPPSIEDPYLAYAKSKNEIWRIVKTELPTNSWCLRLHFLFGVGEARQRFVPAAIDAAYSGLRLELGSPGRRRSWLDIHDAARGLLTAVSHDTPEDWDICSDELISFSELLEVIGEETGRTLLTDNAERAVPDGACLAVEPENLAMFMRQIVKDSSGLRQRLSQYSDYLQAS